MKKIISFVGLFAVLGVGIDDAHGVAMSAQVRRLLQEKQEKIEQLEKCEGKKQGWMIAGISTIGLTAVGVGVNIAQASKSNRLSDEIEMEKTTLQRQQDELDRISNQIADERAKQAKKSGDDSPVYVPAGGAGNSPAGGGSSLYECRYFPNGDGIDINSPRALLYDHEKEVGYVWCGDGAPNNGGCEHGRVLLARDYNSLSLCDNKLGGWVEVKDSEAPSCEGTSIDWYRQNECLRVADGHDDRLVLCLPSLVGNVRYSRDFVCRADFKDTDEYKQMDENCRNTGGSFDDFECYCWGELEELNADKLLCQCIDKNKSFDLEKDECIEKKSSGSGSKSSKSSKTGEKSTQKPTAPGQGSGGATNTGGRVVGQACIAEDINRLKPYGWLEGHYQKLGESVKTTLGVRCETKKGKGDSVNCSCRADKCDANKGYDANPDANGLCVKKKAEKKEEPKQKKEEQKPAEKEQPKEITLDVSVDGTGYCFRSIDGDSSGGDISGCNNPGDWGVRFPNYTVYGEATCSRNGDCGCLMTKPALSTYVVKEGRYLDGCNLCPVFCALNVMDNDNGLREKVFNSAHYVNSIK